VLDFGECAAHENGGDIVGHDQTEGALRCFSREVRIAVDNSFGLHQQLTHRLCEFLGQRSKDHLASDRNEEIVLEEVTQASEGSAGAGLAKMNLLAGAGNALFGDQGIEGHQEIEIESSEVHAFRPTRAMAPSVSDPPLAASIVWRDHSRATNDGSVLTTIRTPPKRW